MASGPPSGDVPPPPRVVVTGLGLVTPLGIGASVTWSALLAAQSGIGPITLFDAQCFPTRIAGEVSAFEAERWIDRRELKTLDRFLQFAIVAGRLALEDAGLPPRFDGEEAERVGCYVGAGFGGIASVEKTFRAYLEKGPRHGFSPYSVPSIIVNLAAGQVSLRHNIRGPSLSHVSACATGAHAVGEAFRAIRYGDCDVMLAGGVEAPISSLGIGGFGAARALSTRNEAPREASRPFDGGRDGFVMSEGAGILVLETLAHAQARGARVYAEVLGYGASSDAHHITDPGPDGEGAQRAMRVALRDARLPAEQVDYVNAHGTSTRLNDAAETRALKRVFGEHAYRLAVSSTKSMTGHLLGAAGAVEAAFCALVLAEQTAPPTINHDRPDPECDLDYVANRARPIAARVAMSNSFGFGGMNASLVFGRAA